jgi:aminopeptidase N
MKDVRQLTLEFSPSTYNLALTLQRTARKFEGNVRIVGNLLSEGTDIPLHAKELTITTATIDGDAAITSLDGDELTVRAANLLNTGKHTVELSFEGVINDQSLHGLYPCYYQQDGQKKEVLATQFESHHAREVFPCVDEPAAKAVFAVTLTTESGVEIITNTPATSQKEVDGQLVTAFEPTPKMSTYLLAFVVGELEHLEAKTSDGVIVRSYATPGQAKYTQFALDTAVRALEFYNDYFGIPYPLPKCDMLGIPDFSAGAMENWGCITFRESCFLVDEKNSDVGTKQFAAQVVIHELAHQWFGNLVTMQWWNDLWLNEGFARFMESFVADKLFPEWNLRTEFLAANVAVAQRFDGLASTHPIQVAVHHPDEISTIFDSISYEKGAAALMMLHNYLGDINFQKGLSAYLAQHQWGNTTTEDLWKALQEASGKDTASFMQQWITQAGFPVVEISEDTQLHLQQSRFFANPQARVKTQEIWPIPLSNSELPALMNEVSMTVPLPTKTPFKLNTGQDGFYFTAYTAAQRKVQKEAIAAGQVGVDDRLGLLNELFELAEAGYLPTREALDFMEAYAQETDDHVWGVMASQLGGIRLLIEDDESAVAALNAYVRRLVTPQLQKLGWDTTPEESLRTRSLRQLIIALACRAEEPGAVREAQARFTAAKTAENLPADLRSTIYATIVRHEGLAQVETLLERYRQESFSEERQNLAAGVCTAQSQEAGQSLLQFMQHEVKPQDVMHWYVYLMRNRFTRAATWQWTVDNWPWITDTFGSDKSYDRFPLYAARSLTTLAEQKGFKAFYEPKKSILALSRAIEQGLERIAINVGWRQRDYDQIRDYLLASSTQSPTAN